MHRTAKLLFRGSLTAAKPTRLASVNISPQSWDSHMHVAHPDFTKFPASSKATYKPHAAPLSAALTNASCLHLPNLVFVQPSTYGTDNSCLLDALAKRGPKHGRGVVVIDAKAPPKSDVLGSWHAAGVRGFRVNLKSVGGTMGGEELARELAQYAVVLKAAGLKGWCVQVYADLKNVPALRAFLEEEERGQAEDRVKLVVDHLGSPPSVGDPRFMAGLEGWTEMVKMLEAFEGFYVKISAPYRISKQWEDCEGAVKELMKARGGRGVVFASDWPHTRFEGLDLLPWVDQCVKWCDGDEELKERLFKTNAERLWDV